MLPKLLTLHWWDGFNAEHQGWKPLPPKEAEEELTVRIKKGALKGELRAESGERVLGLERTNTGQVLRVFPSRGS